jgi:glycosyltransferase involved in cell wall biosynthesis
MAAFPSSFVYDITRLVTRMFNRTPNGIDRVDFAFAEHCLRKPGNSAGCLMSFTGPRLFSQPASWAAVDGIAKHWGEADVPEDDVAYREVLGRLGEKQTEKSAREFISRKRSGQLKGTLAWMRTYGFPLGASLASEVPAHACYLNVSQFPLWIPSYFNWLKKRPDVKAVFFIHDLLPIERPEFFRPAEQERHKKRLLNLAAFGSAAITSSKTVRDALAAYMADLGRRDMPILALPLPVTPIFHAREPVDPELLKGHPYFICCGTIEPRKNHLLLLHVWGALAELYGAATPKLLLIGNRGWENENAVDLLERSKALQGRVIEVSGLSTPALKRLLDGARALLMPSFAEGYGLPLAEALAAGVPVIASDIPVFREIGGDRITKISPIAGDRWLEAIMAALALPLPAQRAKAELAGVETAQGYFAEVDQFLAGL